jgi:hypothetical protein
VVKQKGQLCVLVCVLFISLSLGIDYGCLSKEQKLKGVWKVKRNLGFFEEFAIFVLALERRFECSTVNFVSFYLLNACMLLKGEVG